MKIILSRKGFDSKYGGGCSPILPDGKLLSLPIPSISVENGIPYSKLRSSYGSYKNIMKELGIKIPTNEMSHLDPDITSSTYQRSIGWRGIFGQSGAASSHLSNEKIEVNDIFLFFGSFRKTIINSDNKLVFSESKINHIIFGYMIIDEIIRLGDYNINQFIKSSINYRWSFYHPHLINDKYGKNNIIYIAKETYKGIPGYGSFYFNNKLVLTKPDCKRSIWNLPKYFHPNYGTRISRHKKKDRYLLTNNFLELSTVNIGQEFVVSGNDLVSAWAENLIFECEKFY